jgi:hypothetical protein
MVASMSNFFAPKIVQGNTVFSSDAFSGDLAVLMTVSFHVRHKSCFVGKVFQGKFQGQRPFADSYMPMFLFQSVVSVLFDCQTEFFVWSDQIGQQVVYFLSMSIGRCFYGGKDALTVRQAKFSYPFPDLLWSSVQHPILFALPPLPPLRRL